jgi:hypothetical protein
MQTQYGELQRGAQGVLFRDNRDGIDLIGRREVGNNIPCSNAYVLMGGHALKADSRLQALELCYPIAVTKTSKNPTATDPRAVQRAWSSDHGFPTGSK